MFLLSFSCDLVKLISPSPAQVGDSGGSHNHANYNSRY